MGGGRLDSEIKELMEYIEASSFVEFELEREGLKIKLVKRAAVGNGQAGAPVPAVSAMPPTFPPQSPDAPPARPAAVESPAIHLAESPIVRTLYCSSRPGSPP